MRLKLSKKTRSFLYYVLTAFLLISVSLFVFSTYTYVNNIVKIQTDLRSIQRQINFVISNYDDYAESLSILSQKNYSDDSYEDTVKQSEILLSSVNELRDKASKSSISELKDYASEALKLCEEITKLLQYQRTYLYLNFLYARAFNDFQIAVSVLTDSTYDPQNFYSVTERVVAYFKQTEELATENTSLSNLKSSMMVLLSLLKEYYSVIEPNFRQKNFEEIKKVNDLYATKLDNQKNLTDEIEKQTKAEESLLIASVKKCITTLEGKYKNLNSDFK